MMAWMCRTIGSQPGKVSTACPECIRTFKMMPSASPSTRAKRNTQQDIRYSIPSMWKMQATNQPAKIHTKRSRTSRQQIHSHPPRRASWYKKTMCAHERGLPRPPSTTDSKWRTTYSESRTCRITSYLRVSWTTGLYSSTTTEGEISNSSSKADCRLPLPRHSSPNYKPIKSSHRLKRPTPLWFLSPVQ